MLFRALKKLHPSRRTVEIALLAWILVAQFPLPIVHAHDLTTPQTGSMAEHLATHHTHYSDEAGKPLVGLHWHLLMPWELLDCKCEHSARSGSLFGGWSECTNLPAALLANDASQVLSAGQICTPPLRLSQPAMEKQRCSRTSQLHSSPLLTMRLLGHPMCALCGVALL